VKAAFLDAYFTRGLDVADADVLATLAAEVIGCDASVVSDVLSSDIGRGEVNEELAMAIGHGITGVPTYVIDGAWAIPGAQDTETFERVIRRAIERRTPEAN
jgi:predicted DsbA family dithiol-disulfide isomerase